MFVKIRSQLLQDERLTHADVLLMSYFTGCGYKIISMSNEKLSNLLGLSSRTISRSLVKLKETGYIEIEYVKESRGEFNFPKKFKKIYPIDLEDTGDFYLYRPMWRTELGLSLHQSFLLAFFTSFSKAKGSNVISGFSVQDIADTLKMSWRSTMDGLRALDVLGFIVRDKKEVNGRQYNRYKVAKEITKASTEDELVEAIVDNDEIYKGFDTVRGLGDYNYHVQRLFRRAYWYMNRLYIKVNRLMCLRLEEKELACDSC